MLGLETLKFRYACLALGQLDVEEHLKSGEALIAGLAALMDRSRVPERLRLRLSMLDRIGKSRYGRYRKFLLTNLVEVYFELRDNAVERFERELARPEFKEAKEMAMSHVDKIMEEGREQGLSEGLLRGKQDALLRQLTKKFGEAPSSLRMRIQAITSEETLDALLDRVLEASTLEEMGL